MYYVPVYELKFWETGWIWILWWKQLRIFLHHCPLGLYLIWVVTQKPSIFRWYHHIGRTFCNLGLIFSSFKWEISIHRWLLRKRRKLRRVEATRIWTPCFCGFFVLSGLSQTWCHIHHFHFVMVEPLYLFTFLAQRPRQYLVHNGTFKSHGNLVTHGQGIWRN